MAMNRAGALKDVQWATVPFRGCQFNPEFFPLPNAALPHATLDKAIAVDQIGKMNGGSALAVAFPMISRQRQDLLSKQDPSMKVGG